MGGWGGGGVRTPWIQPCLKEVMHFLYSVFTIIPMTSLGGGGGSRHASKGHCSMPCAAALLIRS